MRLHSIYFISVFAVLDVQCSTLASMYPIDRRALAAHIYPMLQSLRKTAVLLRVSHTTIARWLQNPFRQHRSFVAPKYQVIIETIRTAVLNDPFTSIRSLQLLIQQTHNITVSRELLRSALRRMALTRKKARFYSLPQHLTSATSAFLEARDRFQSEGRLFVSLDETSFGRHVRDIHGYSIIGTRLVIPKKQPRVTTQSCLAAVTRYTVLRTQLIDGSYNKDRFLSFLTDLQLPAGSVLLLDNVRFHHSRCARELAQARGWELLFTPPYSPWFNPIEGIFSVVKRAYYAGASITDSWNAVTPRHLVAFFNHSMALRTMPT